jgi:hypothetical protein
MSAVPAGRPRRQLRTPVPAMRFDVFGFRFDFASRLPLGLHLIRRLYDPFLIEDGHTPTASFRLEATGRTCRALIDDEVLVEGVPLGTALRRAEYEICTRVVASRPDLIVLHGALLSASSGWVLIAGASGSGKTTLALALATRGYRAGGDDIAFLDPQSGDVCPVPRCAHLDRQAWRLLRRLGLRVAESAARHNFVAPADLQPTIAAAPTNRVRHIILLTGADTGARPVLTAMTQAEMVVELLNSAGRPIRAVETLAALARFAGATACYRLGRSRLDTAVDRVAAIIGPP